MLFVLGVALLMHINVCMVNWWLSLHSGGGGYRQNLGVVGAYKNISLSYTKKKEKEKKPLDCKWNFF